MKKRLLSLLLCAIMLLSLLPTATFADSGKLVMRLAVSSVNGESEVTEVKAGDTITVDLIIDENPNLGGLALQFLTKGALTLQKIEAVSGTPFASNFAATNETKTITWYVNEDIYATGPAMRLTFKVDESATGELSIDARPDEDLEDNISHYTDASLGEIEPVPYTITPCTITVAGGGENPNVPVTGVTLSGEGLTSEEGKYALLINEGDTATLTATVDPENATDKTVTWSADKGITVNNGVITTQIGTLGKFTVTAKAGEQTAVCEVTVKHGKLTYKPDEAASCTKEGHQAYWFCDTCQRYYTDDSGAADKETSKAALTIPAGHQYGELIAKVEATCSMNGMKAHYECSRCKKLFDENKDETTKAALTIQATGEHNWGEPDYDWAKTQDGYDCTGTVKCTVCDKQDTVKATVTAEETKTASCMVEGEMTYTATFTGTRFTQQKKTEPIGKAEHKFVKVADAKAATCTADGNKAYWTCSDCHNYFNTEREQINENSWVIKALGHQYGEPAWTWADDNKSATATFTCKREGCDELGDFVKTLTATESSNTLSSEVTKKPTCTEKGTTTYSATVTLKGQDYPDSKTVADIPALGHQYGGPVWTWANDNKSATATFTCTRTGCGHEKPLIVQTSIKETTPATCTEKGTTRYEAKVDFENATYGDEKVVQDIPALGHNFEGQPWQHDETGHWHKCSRCDATDGVQKHVYGVNDCTKEADCACGFHKNAGEHIWNDPVYSWTGYTECTAERACKSCDVTENERAVAVLTGTEPATCTTAGRKVYTATFTKAQFAEQTKEEPLAALGHEMTKTKAKAATCEATGNNEYWYCSRCDKYFSDAKGKTETTVERETLKALGHSYGQPVWTWADDGKTAEVKIVCANDKTHVLTADASVEAGTISSTVKVKPTCTAMGTTTYNAAVSLEGKAYTATKDVQDIPMEAHTMVKTEDKAATCVAAGNNAYWTCSVCKGVFKDELGKTATTVEAETLPIDPANHTGNTELRDAVTATCNMSGHEADTYCKDCGVLLSRGATIPATGKHTYGEDGRCTSCGNVNPAAGVNTDDIKAADTVNGKPVSPDNSGKVIASDDGKTVIRTTAAADDNKVQQVKGALTGGSVTLYVDNRETEALTGSDGGVAALEALAASASGERKQELEKLAEALKALLSDSGRKNAAGQMVYDGKMQLCDADGVPVAELVQSPNSIQVTLPITEAQYQAMQGKKVCVLRSSTDASGAAAVTELSATVGGSQGARVLSFSTDKGGALALAVYETVSSGGSSGGSGSSTAPRTADAGVTVWCALLGISALLGTALVAKKRRQA